MDGSGYWMLRPAVQAYLLNKSLSAGEIAAMRSRSGSIRYENQARRQVDLGSILWNVQWQGFPHDPMVIAAPRRRASRHQH